MKLILIVLFVLFYPLITPLFQSGLFSMHDPTQVARVYEMNEAIREGQFPVRWVKDLGYGYGYPIFNFYGPLPYYYGSFFSFLGLSSLDATKVMFGSGMTLAGISMYLWLAALTRSKSWAFISAIFYGYAPYHAVQLYVRGAIGEMWTLVFLPLIAFGLYKTSSNVRTNILVGSVGVAGTILSHTIMGFVTILGLFMIIAVVAIQKAFTKLFRFEDVQHFFLIVLFGLLLSSFFGCQHLLR